ncbi:MAG: spore coat protein CotJB [Oscillospiraceae bacterium]|nr:spore coat protein CotJB [Oscillospiraceae bacterium]
MEQQILKTILAGATPDRTCVPPDCADWEGELPCCAPLANPYVPFQNENSKRYTIEKGLVRGTLFPGLDLPYLGKVNTEEKGNSGLAELQALAFALNELGLYLDTHADDKEAAELFQSYADLYHEGFVAFQVKNGPIFQLSAVQNGSYLWTHDPWPWDCAANQEE